MWVLDTDHLSILERGGSTAFPLQLRLEQVPLNEVATTIVNYEEQMRGWLSQASRANSPIQVQKTYALLEDHIETFRDLRILSFDGASADRFEQIRQARLRIGTKDLRIAAICLANNATLLSRNLKDFSQVPGLTVEDWSA